MLRPRIIVAKVFDRDRLNIFLDKTTWCKTCSDQFRSVRQQKLTLFLLIDTRSYLLIEP